VVQEAQVAAEKLAKPPEPPREQNVTASRRLRVSGWAQTRYSDAAGTTGSFELRRARLNLRGDISDKIAYRLQADFVRSPVLLDAYVDVNHLSWARLRVGQFKVPFSYENLMSSRELLTVERSLPVLTLVPGRDTGNNGRDIGFRAEGSIVRGDGKPLFDYTVGIFNGAGINRRDDNHRKDGAVRVVVHAAPGLQLAGSYYNGETGTAQVDRERAAAEFSFQRGNWTVRGEYLWSRDGSVHARGSYTMAAYRFRPQWEAVFRFEEIDPRRLVKHDDTRGYLIGLNWYVNRYVKWQNNYVIFDETGKRRVNHTLLSQFQFEF
jgi:phosphate-selective porin